MTAIVLAGGRGLRMRGDKASLRVGGERLIGRVLRQVSPLFDEVLVSVSRGQAVGRLDAPAVEDEVPVGPLGGILSGLRAARNDACAVIACDIPDPDPRLLRSLARAAAGREIAVPAAEDGHFEPLFAIYRRSVIPRIEALLAGGTRGVIPLFDRCRTVFVPLPPGGAPVNLNTRADLRDYRRKLAESKGRPVRSGRSPRTARR